MKSFKLFFSTFIIVFLAELGDKTQIASFSIAAESGNLFSVVLGSAAALTAATLLAVLAGHLIARYIPKNVLKIASGVLFLATGTFILISRLFFS